MKHIITLSFLLLVMSCKEDSQQKAVKATAKNAISNSNAAIQVAIEGKTLEIKQISLEPQKAKISNDSILFEFWEDGNPLKLNFNLFNTDILDKGLATYTIPEVNAQKQKVDLNFYYADRDAKSMNKRIIFKKGTITVSKLTDNQLQMTFEGQGSGIMEYNKTFLISGKVNVNY